MSESLERAAQAFDAVAKAEPQGNKAEGPPERMFGGIGDLEVDEESPEKGGGDDEDPESDIYNEETPKKGGRDEKRREDEEEGDEDEGEDEDDGEGEEDEDDTEFLAQDVQVTVDGEERTVKLKEALEGYIRTETFHKRMNELDEAKKIVRRVAADAVQNYQYSMHIGKEMQAHLEALVPAEPNWDEEFAKNPARARELQKYYEQVRGFKQTLQNKMQEAASKQNATDQAQLAAFAEEESRKFDQANSKNWSDPKKKQKDLQAMRRTALAAQFSEEEISQVYDSRMLMVLLKASKYDRMMAARPKPVQKVREKPVTPGAGSARQRTAHRGVTSAMKRLNRSGGLEDAAVVMDELLKRGM